MKWKENNWTADSYGISDAHWKSKFILLSFIMLQFLTLPMSHCMKPI